jgi:glycosyltransferase involved in cell wall biosynthesis
MSLFNVYIKPLMTQARLYRRAYPIAHLAYLAYPRFGIAFLEASELGRLRIGAASGGVPEVIASRARALFPYGDGAALALAVGATVSRSRRELLAPETIRKTYLKRYSWRLFAERWNSVVRG